MQRTILLIEDDDSLNRGISLKLAKEGYTVHSAFNLAEAESYIRTQLPDLIICDIGLPDGSGLDFCRQLRRNSDVHLLFLTALDTELDIVSGYDAGADDYITKPFSLLVLISKVNAIMNRATPQKAGVLLSGPVALYLNEGRATKWGSPLALTPNEWKLLRLFLENSRKILSKQQLLDCLWDVDSDYIDDNAVAVNIRRLREKIEDDPSCPACIKNIRGMGYIWEMESVAK